MLTPAYEAALALYRQGNSAGALDASVVLVDTPAAAEALQLAALILAETGRVDDLIRVTEFSATRGVPGPVLLARVLDYCLVDNRLAVLENLVNQLPRDSPLFPLSVYFAGCARMVRGEIDQSLSIFRLFRDLAAQPNQQPLIAHPETNVYFRQGCLVAPSAEVGAWLSNGVVYPPALTDFALLRQAQGGPVVYVACADSVYIERFGASLVATLPAGASAHLHVINPRPEALASLAAIEATRPPGSFGYSTSADRQYGHAVAYACARFFVLPLLLDLYGTRLAALDIDLHATDQLARLATLPDDFDFACCRTIRREPSSVFLCGILVCQPTDACRTYLAALARFCLPQLVLPLQLGWLVDQAALFSVTHHFKTAQPDFRFRTLNEMLGLTLDDLAAGVASDEDKHAMRYQAAHAFHGMQSGRPAS